MKRSTAALLALGLVGGALAAGVAPASAAPPSSTWSASAGGDAASVSLTSGGLSLAGLRVADSLATTGTTQSGSTSTGTNAVGTLTGSSITAQSSTLTAPPNAGPTTSSLLDVTGGPVELRSLSVTKQASWAGNAVCQTTGTLSQTTTTVGAVGAAGIRVLPLLANGLAEVATASTTASTQLVQNAGINYGVRSTASGTTAGASLLGGAVTVNVAGTTTLRATSTGTAPTQTPEYSPATVSVTSPLSGTTTVTTATPVTVSVPGVGSVTVSMNAPTITSTGVTAAASATLASIHVTTTAADVTIGLLPLTVSATAPVGGIDCVNAPTITAPAAGAVTGPTPTITGNALPGASVVVTVDATALPAVVANGSGVFTATSPALTTGSHTVSATQTSAGTTSPSSASVAFTVDATAPAAPVITAPANDATTGSTPTISGTAEANSTVKVYDGATLLGTTPANGSGAFSLVPSSPLADGDHTLTATATDAVGNTSVPSAAVVIHVDTVAPAAPVIQVPANGTVTNDSTPLVSGTTEAGTSVTVTATPTAGQPIVSGPVAANGTTFSLSTNALPDGTYTLTATARDAGNNVSPVSNSRTITIDTVAPAAPVITTPATDGTTTVSTVTIGGTAGAGDLVTLSTGTTARGTATASPAGTWSITTAPLANGTYAFTATATDPAGNASGPSNVRTITVAAPVPAAPVITSPANGSTTGAQPTVTGTAPSGTTVRIDVDGTPAGTGTTAANGTFSVAVGPLATGDRVITAVAIDGAGNAGAASAAVRITVSRSLALTGVDGVVAMIGAALGLLLVVGGVVAIVVRRRRMAA